MGLRKLFRRIAAFFGYAAPLPPEPTISFIEPPHGLDEVLVTAVIKEIQEKLDRDILDEIYCRGKYPIRY